MPNSALYFPRTHIPQLLHKIPAGETWMAGAYAAGLDVTAAELWATQPVLPDFEQLVQMVAKGTPVQGMNKREAATKSHWPANE